MPKEKVYLTFVNLKKFIKVTPKRGGFAVKINSKQFEEGLAVCSSSSQRQLQWLESIGFELDAEITNYFGVFISDDDIAFEVGDDVHIYVLQDDEFIDDARVAELESGISPTDDEIKHYVQLRIDEMREGEAHPWIFWGSLECGDENLYVLASKVGYSFEGIDVDLIGIFKSLDEAIETAFIGGTLYRE